MKKVSIVIVCMNNLENLLPCIQSIKKYTKITDFDIWIVAYLFSPENLKKLRDLYPDVIILESNEIRGFAENNNLALHQITSEYALVLNDDTLFKEPVLDKLVESIERTPDADFMSPKLVNKDGSYQSCGKAPATIWRFVLATASLEDPNKRNSPYINQKGVFKTYNCTGACFLVKMNVLKKLGYFDEYYFFMPEDIALSTLANKRGYHLYVDSNITLYHLHQRTGSKVKVATLPAARKGSIYFYANGNSFVYYTLALYVFILSLLKSFLFLLTGNSFNSLSQWHCVESIFSKKTPKQIFTKYYNKLQRKNI